MPSNEFSRQWPGQLGKIEFAAPRRFFPDATSRFFDEEGLPKTFTITGSQVLQFTTISRAENLNATWESQTSGDWVLPVGWDRFWRIGDIKYTQADAWRCIEELTGHIYGIDIEIDNPIYLIAKSVSNLASSMRIPRSMKRNSLRTGVRI